MIQDNNSKRKSLRQQQQQQQKPITKSASPQKPRESTKTATKSPVSIPTSTSGQSGEVQSQLATMCSSLLRNEQTLLQMLQNQIQRQTVSREGIVHIHTSSYTDTCHLSTYMYVLFLSLFLITNCFKSSFQGRVCNLQVFVVKQI